MRKFLENLNSKPKPIRRQILYLTVSILTGLVFVFWAFTLPYRFQDVKKENLANAIEPLKVIKESVKTTYKETYGE